MKDFVSTVLFCLPIQTNLWAAWGQNLKPGNRKPEIGGAGGQGQGPGTKGASELEAGQEGSRGSLPEWPPAGRA